MSNRELIERLRFDADCLVNGMPNTGFVRNIISELRQAADALGQMEWVSVETEVPVHESAVIVWYEDGMFGRAWYDASAERFRDDALTLREGVAVTHWLSPTPPGESP